jgi:hypothetical protein
VINPGGYFTVGSIVAADGSVPVTFKWSINAPGGICGESALVSDRNSEDVYGSFDVVSSNVPRSITFQDPAWGDYSNGEPGLDVDVTVTDCLNQEGSSGTFSHVYLERETAATFSSGWRVGSCTCWTDGTAKRSTRAGQTATFRSRGNGFALVGVYGPGRGTADIYVDGRKVRAVNAAKATTTNRAIVFQTHFNGNWRTSVHTIKVVVTSGRFDIDGWITTGSNR